MIALRRWLSCVGIIACVAITASSIAGEATPSQIPESMRNMAAVDRALELGMGTNELKIRFGTPYSVNNLTDQASIWDYYAWPNLPNVADLLCARIWVTNGFVAKWRSMYFPVQRQTVASNEPVTLRSNNTAEAVEMKLYIVSSTALRGGRYVSSGNLTNLGYISEAPLFKVRRLEGISLKRISVPSKGAADNSEWQLDIELCPEDSVGLRDLTVTNLFQRMLITVDDKPVIAPVIHTPIERDIAISLVNKEQVEAVKSAFAQMQKRN